MRWAVAREETIFKLKIKALNRGLLKLPFGDCFVGELMFFKNFKDSEKVNSLFINTIFFGCAIATIFFVGISLFMLNRGFSIWDEGYYLLSYKMAYDGFYPHFNNAPFVVARFFEWFEPGIVGYRVIHGIMALIFTSFLCFGVLKQLETTELISKRNEKYFLLGLALFAAAYAYQVSLATLNYNHLNEFFFLTSQACLLAISTDTAKEKRNASLIILSAFLCSFDIFIKPPTFILLVILNLAIIFVLSKKQDLRRRIILFVFALVVSLFVSFFWIMTPTNWADYFSMMKEHQSHTPKSVLIIFFSSFFDMLKKCYPVVLSGLALIFLDIIASKFEISRPSLALRSKYMQLCVALVSCFLLFKLLFPTVIWDSFNIHWFFFWIYSSTFLLSIILYFGFGGLFMNRLLIFKDRSKLTFLIVILAANPLMMVVGTLNGFGQVQLHLVSWMILIGIIFLIILKRSTIIVRAYSTLLILLCIGSSVAYITRQQSAENFSGQGSIFEFNDVISEGPLKNIRVDRKTYDLISQMKVLLDLHPDLPTVVFFDAPGLQYAFGRSWIVKDPWLTNYEQPLTKDDPYNCRILTRRPEQMKKAIFIVVRSQQISSDLLTCLSKIGYPNQMKLIGKVETSVGYMPEPIQVFVSQ